MSQTVKTYGRRNAGVAFRSSASAPRHVFSSSSSTTACSSDGSGDSPPPPPPSVPETKLKRQRKASKKATHDAENEGVGLQKRQPAKKGISTAKRPFSKSTNDSNSSLQSCPRRPLADRNAPVDDSQRAAAEKKPTRKLRCKNRRRTIKLSVPVVSNVPDFSDIENHSLFIVDDNTDNGAVHSARLQAAADCFELSTGKCRRPAAAASSGRPLQASASFYSGDRRKIFTRSSRQLEAAGSAVHMFDVSSYHGKSIEDSSVVVLSKSSQSCAISGAGHAVRPAEARKSISILSPVSSHLHCRSSCYAIHGLETKASSCDRLPRQLPEAGVGCTAISTPVANVDTRPPHLTMEGDVDVSAIEDVEEAPESPLQVIMTRSRLQRLQPSSSLFSSPSGTACHDANEADGRSAVRVSGHCCRPACSGLQQLPQCDCSRSQDSALRSSGCSGSASRSAVSSAFSGSSRRAGTAAETSSSSMCLRSGKQYASVLSATGTTDRLESIAEADYCEDVVVPSAAACHFGSGTLPSLLTSRSLRTCSPDRGSLSVLFPVDRCNDDSLEKDCDDEAAEIWTFDLSDLPAMGRVLMLCGQEEYVPFADVLVNCEASVKRKVGEGVFGEVFLLGEPNGGETVIKVVPIEGDFKVNDEPQKTFEEILPEIAISRELSDLRHARGTEPGSYNACDTFIHLASVLCIQGSYPSELLAAWKNYDRVRGSQNDCPAIFGCKQLYILFEFDNGGSDLESYQFNHVGEGVSVLRQVVCGLAVAERTLRFEHRDLHWGNVLVKPVDDPNAVVSYLIDGEDVAIPAVGVYVSIIDFTLSRLDADGRTIFMDLANDDTLFTGKGDYQFDIYRKMKKHNGNKWDKYEPFSNVLWIHYLADKIANAKTYPRDQKSKNGRGLLGDLRQFLKRCLQYSSASDILQCDPLFSLSS